MSQPDGAIWGGERKRYKSKRKEEGEDWRKEVLYFYQRRPPAGRNVIRKCPVITERFNTYIVFKKDKSRLEYKRASELKMALYIFSNFRRGAKLQTVTELNWRIFFLALLFPLGLSRNPSWQKGLADSKESLVHNWNFWAVYSYVRTFHTHTHLLQVRQRLMNINAESKT